MHALFECIKSLRLGTNKHHPDESGWCLSIDASGRCLSADASGQSLSAERLGGVCLRMLPGSVCQKMASKHPISHLFKRKNMRLDATKTNFL